MQNKTPELPASVELDVGAVAAFFKSNDTSYKFLWLLSVLELMEKSDAPLPADKIVMHMLDMARPLIEKYRLRFGKQDRMESFLTEQRGAQEKLSNHVRNELLKFAPYRLLTSFFKPNELSELSAAARHNHIRKIAAARFGDKNPILYKFKGEAGRIEAIEIHPAWRSYLLENIAIVRGWIRWHWALFLEARNPNRPNIVKQILPELSRETHEQQRDFWRQVMGHAQIKCLYSGENLSVNDFTLDHYIPFNFIGHNRLWNLHPVAKRANSAKSDRLPHARYFDGFIEQQQTAMATCWQKKFNINKKRFALAEYGEGLNIDVEKEVSADEIKSAYQILILPLMTIAHSYGFSDSWKYVSGEN